MDTPTPKYFRTPHCEWSLGSTADDLKTADISPFIGVPVVVTEKLDGGNRKMEHLGGAVFARSAGAPDAHPSASWARQKHASLRYSIDPHLSVFMEDCFALHSIWYRKMACEREYLHVFAVRDNITKRWWAWEDVEMMAAVLGLPTVPVLFKGVLESKEQLQILAPGDGNSPSMWGGVSVKLTPSGYVLTPDADPDGNIREGAVIRKAGSFENPLASVIKVVRPHHVQTSIHWKTRWVPQHQWAPNQLREDLR